VSIARQREEKKIRKSLELQKDALLAENSKEKERYALEEIKKKEQAHQIKRFEHAACLKR